MTAVREQRELEIRAYAKINLALDVTGIRPDGYHSVDTIMQRVSLADLIQLRWQEEHRDAGKEPVQITVTTTKPYSADRPEKSGVSGSGGHDRTGTAMRGSPAGKTAHSYRKTDSGRSRTWRRQQQLCSGSDCTEPSVAAALQYAEAVCNRRDARLGHSILRTGTEYIVSLRMGNRSGRGAARAAARLAQVSSACQARIRRIDQRGFCGHRCLRDSDASGSGAAQTSAQHKEMMKLSTKT